MAQQEQKILVCSEKCKQCLFTKNRIVSKERATEIIAKCLKEDDFFLCHLGTIAGKKVVCKGFIDAYGHLVWRVRQAIIWDFFKEIKPKDLYE